MKRRFRTTHESVAHATTLVASAFTPREYRAQLMMTYGDYIIGDTWRNRLDYILVNLGCAWDAGMCAITGHDMQCSADPESGHTDHWCDRCGYSFDVWM